MNKFVGCDDLRKKLVDFGFALVHREQNSSNICNWYATRRNKAGIVVYPYYYYNSVRNNDLQWAEIEASGSINGRRYRLHCSVEVEDLCNNFHEIESSLIDAWNTLNETKQ